jgi:hypothetical protein
MTWLAKVRPPKLQSPLLAYIRHAGQSCRLFVGATSSDLEAEGDAAPPTLG